MSFKNCLYVGVDVSLKSLTTCILDISGETIFKPKNFSNDPDGAEKLLDTVLSYANSLDVSHILFGVEATSVYGTHFLYTIADSNIFSDFTVPTQVEKLAEICADCGCSGICRDHRL